MNTENVKQPVVEMKGKEISQIGIVVRDAAKTAKRYSRIFGIGPWYFIDVPPAEVILHDKSLENVESCIRLAITNLGKMQMELIQPMYGPSTHMEFLNERGEGIHHVSFGNIDEHDTILSALKGQGIGIEMQGLIEGMTTFTYLATQKKLGTIFEMLRAIPSGSQTAIKPWGTYAPQGPGVVDLKGKEITQVGIIVEDAERTAKNYWELFGIGPWMFIDFKSPNISDGLLHGISIVDDADVQVRAAIANHGDLQFELLEPVCGPTTHMEFLKMKGEGIHHVSFGEVDDHDAVVSALQKEGIEVESTGLLGGAATFTYMASQNDLGTIFEVVKAHPGAETTIVPYGTYPPDL